MKYEMKRERKEAVFEPFSITLTFETKAEYVNFYDNVMEHIPGLRQGCSLFYQHVSEMGNGVLSEACGHI